MIKYLNLFRWINISIVILSMALVLLFMVLPLLGIGWFEHGLCPGKFLLLVFSTVFIAIGGNIVNDIYDINADSINKPRKNMVGKGISVSTAWVLYWVFTVSGLLLGTLLSLVVGQINYGLIFLFSAGLLWFYSQKYQCQPLVGNIVVSALSAITLGIVWLFQFFALSEEAEVFASVQGNFAIVNRMVLIYMGFAFITSLIREVVKDIEDFRGDNRFGCRTFAVTYGIEKAKILAKVVLFIGIFSVVIIQFYFFKLGFEMHFWYFFVLDVLFVLAIFKMFKAKDRKDFSTVSKLIKLIMLAGILSMAFFYFY